jgi:hypothetical protein
MSDACPATGDLVAIEIGRIATQYREAARLKAYMRAVLGLVEEAAIVTCGIPSAFDLGTAIGDQLSLIGKRMGFPRAHCACETAPVYGIACEGSSPLVEIAGPCDDATWIDCGAVITSTLRIDDDTIYRAHLLARRYQMLGLYDIDSLTAAIRHLWGPAAWVPDAGHGRVVVAPGRALTTLETRLLPISFRILPVAPGLRAAVHLGTSALLGTGSGWAGSCDDGEWLCPVEIDPYSC